MRITVLAGGWSASRFNLAALPGTIIAVNDAALNAPRWDICLSMDRLWAEHRWSWIEQQRRPVYVRGSTLKNVVPDGLDHVVPFANDHTSTTLSDEPGRLNGTHSGFCALNLAYQLRPSELYLVGFDMARGPANEAHWFPQYPWVKNHATSTGKLAIWAQQFATAARQLRDAGIATY
jgi:hypothetical protein